MNLPISLEFFPPKTPEGAANLCFGGADGKTLFITARTSLYAIPTLTTQALVK